MTAKSAAKKLKESDSSRTYFNNPRTSTWVIILLLICVALILVFAWTKVKKVSFQGTIYDHRGSSALPDRCESNGTGSIRQFTGGDVVRVIPPDKDGDFISRLTYSGFIPDIDRCIFYFRLEGIPVMQGEYEVRVNGYLVTTLDQDEIIADWADRSPFEVF